MAFQDLKKARFNTADEALRLGELRSSQNHDAVAALNEQIYQAACDIEELGKTIKGLMDSEADNASLGKPLHLFCALTTLRINRMLKGSVASPEESPVIKALQGLLTRVSAIDHRDPETLREIFPSVMAGLWHSLSEVSLFNGNVHLAEYDREQHTITPELIEEIASVCSELVIDPARGGPQEGFGRNVMAPEIEDLLHRKGSLLFVLEHEERIVGFFIYLTDRAHFPPEAEKTCLLYEKEKGKLPANVGFLSMVGILKDFRHAENEAGIYPYPFMASAAAQSAYNHRIAFLLGEVRVGANANLAHIKHEAVGLYSTGLRVLHGSNEYEILTLNPSSVDFYASPAVLEEAAEWHGMGTNDQFPSYRAVLEQLDRRTAPIEAGEFCAPNGDTEDMKRYLKEQLPQYGKVKIRCFHEGLAVQGVFGASKCTIRQLIPNQDMWTCDLAGDRHEIHSFIQAVDLMKQESCKNAGH